MRIIRPVQALCADRRQVTMGVDPLQWIVPALPPGWTVRNFHFFVDWSVTPLSVGRDIWLTRLLLPDLGTACEQLADGDVMAAFVQSNASEELLALAKLCDRHGLAAVGVVLPEVPSAAVNDHTPVWLVTVQKDQDLVIRRCSLAELRQQIRQHSGGAVHVGAKGLTYGTSAVECYLSRSDSAYPGDADAVLVDPNDNARFVVEFKKHTVSAPIGEHLASRYYPVPDGRKYQRLYALVSTLQQRTPAVGFSVLYYSTRSPSIRLQVIKNVTPQSLVVSHDTGDLGTSAAAYVVAQQIVRAIGVVA